MEDDLPAFAFGDTPEMADALLSLVLDGRKTATCSARSAYGREDEIPRQGMKFHVLDGRGNTACLIEVTRVVIRAFREIDEEFARLEGEGDGSLAYWRSEHRAFFERAGCFSEDMLLVCEYFRVVERRTNGQ